VQTYKSALEIIDRHICATPPEPGSEPLEDAQKESICEQQTNLVMNSFRLMAKSIETKGAIRFAYLTENKHRAERLRLAAEAREGNAK